MHFCSCDLDLDLMTLNYELDLEILKVYMRTKNELSRSRLQKLEHYRQTDRQTDTETDRQTHRQKTTATENIREGGGGI